MKILVINNQLEQKHIEVIKTTATSLFMVRRLDEFFEETRNGQWLPPCPQRSLKDSRVTVLGTGDIGTNFEKRARAFEPSAIIGVCRSGKSNETVYDKVLPVSELDSVLPQTDLLAMSLPSTPENGHLAGAALDVFRKEPLPQDSRLWKTKKLLITPHIAGNMTLQHTRDKNVQMFLEDLKNFTEGKTLRYLVDRTLGY